MAGVADAPFLEFLFDPPEWSRERRDFCMGEPLRVNARGTILLSDRPGLGFDLDENALARTRIG